MDKFKFGEFVYNRRIEIGLTQEELGYKLGVTNKAVSKWETGETLPDISLLENLANVLQVSVDELLSQKKKVNPYKKQLLALSISCSVLVLTVIVLSSSLIYKSVKEKNEYDSLGTITVDSSNFSEYFTFNFNKKYTANGENLAIISEVTFDKDQTYTPNVSFSLTYSVIAKYYTTADETKLISYANLVTKVTINSNLTTFTTNIEPVKSIDDFSHYIEIDFNSQLSSAEGTITRK